MPNHMMRCQNCQQYTMSIDNCPRCGGPLENVFPPKFSMEDKYQKYRQDFFQQKMAKKFPKLN
jgi:H/ACA ribonucleoprotein complex subunit 3